MSQSFAIVSGDQRLVRLARLLLQDGHSVYTWALAAQGSIATKSLQDTVARAHCIIWPVPLLTPEGNVLIGDEILPALAVLQYMRSDQIAVGGRIPQSLIQQARENEFTLVDYTTREDFAIANAVPSAEGAIALAMAQTERTLHTANCLIIGFGRIGKVLAAKLRAMGATVTIAARKLEDFLWCEAQGYHWVETGHLDGRLAPYAIVFNTVPHLVLGDGRLSQLQQDCLVVDLASAPGGVDFQAAKRRGINCHWALGLPGKVAPETAAEILRDTIYHIVADHQASQAVIPRTSKREV